jgi:3-keto-5-aminohexanoate cleavage enzyme
VKSSKTTEKLIVTVSPTGGIHGKEAHPGLPEQPDEIADAVFKCWNEGASIAHIHARDPVGRPTNDPDILRDIDRRIREKKCDIIIQHSTAADFVPRLPENKAIRAIEMNPEMASLSVTWPRVLSFRNEDRVTMLSMEEIVHSATTMRERGIKPELEVYSPVVMEEIHDMVDSGVVEKPCWINFVFGMRRVNRGYMDFSPQMLLHLISLFPDGSLFNVTGVGRMQLPATTMSV